MDTRDILIRFEMNRGASLKGAAKTVSASGTQFDLEPLFEIPIGISKTLSLDGRSTKRAVWHLARSSKPSSESPWDTVYQTVNSLRVKGATVTHAEPDQYQVWPTIQKSVGVLAADGDKFEDQTEEGGRVLGPRIFAWHLDDAFSGLNAARQAVHGSQNLIRIAHLDVGYGLDHAIFPKDRIELELSRNFTDDGRPDNDIEDRVNSGGLRNPGHGTGTLGILAGERFKFPGTEYIFDSHIGAAIEAKIVGLRIGNSVAQFKTSSIAKAIAYVADLCKDESTRVHVLSMSMGGLASNAWADAVNYAYMRGVVLVTAAGNNFAVGSGGLPTTYTIYPARFDRVLSACGVMANLKPYYGLKTGTMQGCHGPKSKNDTSISAFTPNTPWARRSDKSIVDMDGAGTSSATPQIAGAAALYLQKHGQTIFSKSYYPEEWMRVEVVRNALRTSAKTDFSKDDLEKLGSGVLRADKALDIAPVNKLDLKQSSEAKVSFPFLKTLFGLGAKDNEIDPNLQLELAQLIQQWDDRNTANPFDDLLTRADSQSNGLTSSQQKTLIEMLRRHPKISSQLRSVLNSLSGDSTGTIQPSQSKPVYSSPSKFVPEVPKHRELRGYALDPSFAVSLATRKVAETVYRIPWDPKMSIGPSDEYIQVIDVDPSSKYVYEPVDLNHTHLLANKGLAPSEGTPQFHQQMVYAVARTTIDNFEKALGRLALWRPGLPPIDRPQEDDSIYVPRLRIYPHALREANAFYSPQKIALLFGYFDSDADTDLQHPRQQIFTCLSQDIVAHETTHALLDGMHRKYLSDSNPDVLAFHEAFADIVALFQRLMLPDLLQHQIATTRGEIRTRRSLLGQLATQFGQATGERGGLREAIGKVDVNGTWFPTRPDGTEYNSSTEPHSRGSVLVAAVFDAFISIYEGRTEDLMRIATEGTGVLRPGALHPDLVARLASEASKAASHVLRMCIRALDYCPPTDITFGEYLRAIITADYEIVSDDDLGYRIAFVEAFRNRGIKVGDVRTLSVESLLWRREENEQQQLSQDLCERLWEFRAAATAQAFTDDRQKIFEWQHKVRLQVHNALKDHFKDNRFGASDACVLGLDHKKPFEVHSARFAMRVGPDGQLLSQAIIGLLQRDQSQIVDGQAFEGGSTVIADLADQKIRYIIRKNVSSPVRLDSQREYKAAMIRGGASTYWQSDDDEPFAALHLHAGGK